jgi:hypothetical protein
MESKELAPGIMLYKTDKAEVQEILRQIDKELDGLWTKSQVVDTETYDSIDDSGRKCHEYIIGDWTVGTNDQKEVLYNAILNWIQPKVDDFVDYYHVEKVVSGPFIILKYEQSDRFDDHIDDGGRYPRTVSVSAYLNDDYDGGEIEFPLFGISHKPEAGDIVVFSSSFPYVHRVLPTSNGTRYAVVDWYRYENYPEEIYK